MAGTLSEKLFIPVTLRACEVLLKRHNKHRLYTFLCVGSGKSRFWVILPQREIVATAHGWSEEDKATIDRWLAKTDCFHAFMLPRHQACFKNPHVDYVDGKLVIRSGKKKITPLDP
jgi:hypothetical protein